MNEYSKRNPANLMRLAALGLALSAPVTLVPSDPAVAASKGIKKLSKSKLSARQRRIIPTRRINSSQYSAPSAIKGSNKFGIPDVDWSTLSCPSKCIYSCD